MALVSSRITARDEAYLVAAGKVELLAAQNSSYSLYDMKKKAVGVARKPNAMKSPTSPISARKSAPVVI